MTGSGTSGDPYIISSVADWKQMDDDVAHRAAYYKLAANLDCTGENVQIGVTTIEEIKRPNADYSSQGSWTVFPAAPTTKYDKVDEVTPDEDTTYIQATAIDSRVLFGFPSFTIPSDAQNIIVSVHIRVRNVAAGGSYWRAALRVNGTVYETSAWSVSSQSWGNRVRNFIDNPATGEDWTVDDVNGTGSNPLQQFGALITDVDPNPRFTQFWIRVQYSLPFLGSLQAQEYELQNVDSISGGLFRLLMGTVTDLWVKGISISLGASTYEGAFARYIQNGATVRNCHIEGSITGSPMSGCGFAYYIQGPNCLVEKSTTKVTLNLSGTSTLYANGFVHKVTKGAVVRECYVDSTLVKCTTTANTANVAAFFVGPYDEGTLVKDCYVKIATLEADDYATGFFNQCAGGAIIDNCMSIIETHTAATRTGFGSIIGYGSPDGSEVRNSFWDKELSGVTTSVGGVGKTTAQMKNMDTFLAWYISPHETILNNQYPFHGWRLGHSSTWLMLGEDSPREEEEAIEDKVTLEAIRNIEMVGRGRFYVDKAGKARYESRHGRNP